MKKIKLKQIVFADKSSLLTRQRMHRVYLGNRLRFYFSDLKDAKAFLSDCNQFLNFKLYELNETYIEIRSIYRRVWFYLDIDNFKTLDGDLTTSFTNIDRAFERTYRHYKDYYVFKDLKLISENLILAIQLLITIQKTRNNYSEVHQLQTIISRIQDYNQQINEYGKDSKFHNPTPEGVRCTGY